MSLHDEVKEIYHRLLSAWNDRDAGAMAACFADDGVSVGFDGSAMFGREAIEDHLKTVFADHPTPKYVSVIRHLRLPSQGMAVLVAEGGMVPPGGQDIDPQANAVQSLVLHQFGGNWSVELFQNTPAALHMDEAGRERMTGDLRAAFRAQREGTAA